MINITATDGWHAAHPGTMMGLLEFSGVDNTAPSQELNQRKRETEARLRQQYTGFTRQEFLGLPVMEAYDRYYKHFDKTYHVQLQLESIVLKSRNLPDVSPLVDAYFLAEVETLVLTAGHDVDRLEEPVMIDVSGPGEVIAALNGETKPIRAGDMVMRDRQGICCAILYGQDRRSPITPGTQNVVYVAYVPARIPEEMVEAHLQKIEKYVRLFSPSARLEQERIIRA